MKKKATKAKRGALHKKKWEIFIFMMGNAPSLC